MCGAQASVPDTGRDKAGKVGTPTYLVEKVGACPESNEVGTPAWSLHSLLTFS